MTNFGARLAIGKPTPVTCLSGGGAQGSTGAESSEWKQRLVKNTGRLLQLGQHICSCAVAECGRTARRGAASCAR
jgi:hypothetical protein